MGIVDGYIQERRPRTHTIVEAHPDVRAHMSRAGWDEKKGVTVEFGRWQDVLPRLAERGVKFDAIFFDTYGEEYDDMRQFHAMLPKLLREGGVYSYFNGMCPDNIFFHMVYNRVAEIELGPLGVQGDVRDEIDRHRGFKDLGGREASVLVGRHVLFTDVRVPRRVTDANRHCKL